jgi:hypothetical protein
MIFRAVGICERVTGRLFLHSVLGRYEAYEGARQEMFPMANRGISEDHDTF